MPENNPGDSTRQSRENSLLRHSTTRQSYCGSIQSLLRPAHLWRGLRHWFQANTHTPDWLTGKWGHPWVGYAVALIAQLLACGAIIFLLRLFPSSHFSGALMMLVVVFVSLTWGAGPGIIAVIAGTFLLDFFLIEPLFRFSITQIEDIAELSMYVVVGLTMNMLASRTTRAKRRAEELEGRTNQALREAIQANQHMDDFMSMAGHELRTPLTSIKGNLQLTQRRLRKFVQSRERLIPDYALLLEEVGKMLDRTSRQVELQNRLVSDLLDASRIQANKFEMRLAPCSLVAIVQEIVEVQRQLTAPRVIHLSTNLSTNVVVEADADRIGQVLTNLLTNALKYSPTDQPVDVMVEEKDQECLVSVRDQGPGLPAEEQERIWERFYRVKGMEAQSGSSVGLGLGLYICKKIILSHGGNIGVESTPGQGSTFWFTLPESLSPLPEKTCLQLQGGH